MNIVINCPHCNQEMVIDDSGVGQSVPCPTCSKDFVIPQGRPEEEVKKEREAAAPEPEEKKKEDKKRGAELYHRFTKSKLKKEDVVKMLTTEGERHYSLQPERTMEFARFLHSIDSIKNMPSSWKDYYWENNYDQSGS